MMNTWCVATCKDNKPLKFCIYVKQILFFFVHCRAFAAFVSYFVIGAVILRVKYQKSGTDLIINKEFWKDFPMLVKVNL